MSQQKGLWTGHRKRRHFYFVSVFFLVLGLVMGVLFKWEMWAARSMREVSEKSEDPKPKWGLNSYVCIIFVLYFILFYNLGFVGGFDVYDASKVHNK